MKKSVKSNWFLILGNLIGLAHFIVPIPFIPISDFSGFQPSFWNASFRSKLLFSALFNSFQKYQPLTSKNNLQTCKPAN
jgi:hypothetical protein